MSGESRSTAKVLLVPDPPNTKHFLGIPPIDGSGVDMRLPLGTPVLLVIEVKTDGGIFSDFLVTEDVSAKRGTSR